MTAIRCVLAATMATLSASAAYGQEHQPAASKTPTIAYVDKAFGFELQVPAGWTYDRTGFFGPGGSRGLLRGASPDGRATLQILAFRELQLPNFPDWIEFFSKQLAGISGTEQVRVKPDTNSQRPAAYVVVEARFGVDRTRTLYYCVRFDADTIWVFSYATALGRTMGDSVEDRLAGADEDVTIPADFTRLSSTLRVLYDPELARQMAVALKRGKEYLARYQLQDDIRKLRIDESVRYYEIRVAGKPLGFLTRQFTREREPLQRPSNLSNPKEGLRVRERSYRFADDGTVYFNRIDLFSSRDAETDLYELSEMRLAPPDAAVEPLIVRDQCVRESDALFSTCTSSRDQGLPAPRRPLKLDASYLGLAWARLLPALLGPQPRPVLAFTAYDPETRTLVSHAIKPLGEKPLPGEPARKVYAFETRDGFTEQPAVMYADQDGNMLRFEAGKFVLTLSDETTIEKKFGRRRAAADRRLERRP